MDITNEYTPSDLKDNIENNNLNSVTEILKYVTPDIENLKLAIRLRGYDIIIEMLKYISPPLDVLEYILDYFPEAIIEKILELTYFDILQNNGEILTIYNDRLISHIDDVRWEGWSILSHYLNLIYINDEEEISSLSKKFVAEAKTNYLYPIGNVYDPHMMIKYGFFPTSVSTDYMAFSDYVKGVPLLVIEFWNLHTNLNIFKILDNLKREMRWIYQPLEIYKRQGITSAKSLPLLLFAPELVYKISKRPITDMSLFRGPTNHRIKYSEIPTLMNIIPITRYAHGMSRGLYHNDDNNDEHSEKFCGTFYYYEIKSTTFLRYNTSLRFFNKYQAMKYLIGQKKEINIETDEIIKGLEQDDIFMDFVNGILPKDLMLTPTEAYDICPSFQEDKSRYNVRQLPRIKHYAGVYLGLYALEDELDQPLCILARSLNIDIIILESMVGSHQVVTEVLDSRSRDESFSNLIYVTN